MGTKEKAAKLLKSTISMISAEAAPRSDTTLSNLSNLTKGIDFSALTDDGTILKYVQEFHLDDPKVMINFIIEVWNSQFDSIRTSINMIAFQDMKNSLSFIDRAQSFYRSAISDPDNYTSDMTEARKALMGLKSIDGKIVEYINAIRAIDSASAFKRFVSAKHNIDKINTYNSCAKTAVNAVYNGYNLRIAIETALSINTQNTINEFEDFKAKMLDGDNCTLMHAYDKDKASEFWTKLPQRLENAIHNSESLIEFVEIAQEEESIDYDSIDFS